MRRTALLMGMAGLVLLLAAGVALAGVTKTCPKNCKGTQTADTLTGSNRPNQIKGLGGGDLINGLRNDDTLYGNAGDDRVNGGLGDDEVYGGNGNDYVEGDYGHDLIDTGLGSDLVAARDGYEDRIICGEGTEDRVYADAIDIQQGCEIQLEEEPSPPSR
jgi:hypothetical protein